MDLKPSKTKNARINKTPEAEVEKIGRITLKDSILRLIWRESQISRAEISRQMNLSRSTVTEIVKELLLTGFIVEVGSGESSGGRRPIVLQFQDDAKVILGIDIGARHISVAVTNLRGKLLLWVEKKFPAREDSEGAFSLIDALCEECFSTLEIDRERLLSIGVSVPSPVDPVNPDYLSEGIIPAWQGKSGIDRLRGKFGVPVLMDNDANAGALAEHWFGAGKNFNDIVFIKIATGIGAGFILGGKLYRGAKGIAGEMSHMPIDPSGTMCVCGMRGCLSTVITAKALVERARFLATHYPDSILLKNKITVNDIEEAALQNDPMAVQIVSEAAIYLRSAIISLVNLLNPELIVLGGSLSRLGDMLLTPIREKMNEVALVNTVENTKVRVSELGSQGIAMGAATLAIEQAFTDPKLLRKNIQPAVMK